MEYLCFWVTCNCVIPIKRKIEAITNMKSPTSQKEVQAFIGRIKYFPDMWPRRSHMLVYLTKLTSVKRKLKCKKVKKYAFDEIKRIVACDDLLTYLDFKETFKIHTNASSFQLGAVIIKKVKPIVFYSR